MENKKYVHRQSTPGGIHDQMNCINAFMVGYGFVLDVADPEQKKTKDIRYQYATNRTQWQIGQIELACQQWGLSVVDALKLAEYLYCYCPSYSGSNEDYERLRRLGSGVKALGVHPTKAPDLGDIEDIRERAIELQKLAEDRGLHIIFEIK